MFFFFENRISSSRKDSEQFAKLRRLWKRPFTISGVSIPISDITGKTDKGWHLHYASGGFHVQDHEFLQTLDKIIRRNAAWTVSQTYERFEAFLYDISAHYLHVNQGDADKKEKEKFENNCKTGLPSPNSVNYWKQFVRFCYRGKNNNKIFCLIRNLAPQLPIAEKKNNRGADLPLRYEFFSEVRHAVIHADFIVKDDRIARWSKEKQYRLLRLFPANRENNKEGYRLAFTPKAAEEAIRYVAEYAFQTFKALSLSKGYEWNILEGLRGKGNRSK
jgi:hypothetical protein